MNFEEAYDAMQEGERVTLPEWSGYWYWDDDQNTIMIHNKDGTELDLRETTSVDWTIRFTFRDDWELHISLEEKSMTSAVEQPHWWDEVNFEPNEPHVFKRGENGDHIKNLQRDLNRVGANLTIDGDYGPGTERAVRDFQKRVGLVADGVFGEKTAAALDGHPFPSVLEHQDIEWAAQELQCEVAAIMAVSEIESRGRGFFGSGRPVVLFERHWMRRRLDHHGIDYRPHMRQHPNIVNTKTGGYKGGEAEHDRITLARDIHDTSALESASWGAYQIMGFHWESLGYSSVQAYVEEMEKGERQHLEAFVRFNLNDPVLIKAIREKDFASYARRYNGPAYAKNKYDTKMANAYTRHQQALA